MEFFIKKNATLPVLKINVIKDGRSDYDRSMQFLTETDIFFSMVNVDTGIPKITSRPAGVVAKLQIYTGQTPDYYVYYQFTPFDTRQVGRYKGQFLFRNDTGILTLPLSQEIYINVTDSFILDDMEFQSCYVVDYPCCFASDAPIPIPTTTTTTVIPVTTTTTVIPVTTTTTVIPVTTTTTVIPVTTTTTIIPTVTPTQSVTLTPTITPTYTPTPTPTVTPTPLPHPIDDLNYIFIPNNDINFIEIPTNDFEITNLPNNDLLTLIIPYGNTNVEFIPNDDLDGNQIPNDGIGTELIPNNDLMYDVLNCGGKEYNLVVLPWEPPSSGNTIFPGLSGMGGIGITDPNTFDVDAVYWSVYDRQGNEAYTYFSGIGTEFIITFTQNGNSAVYSGNSLCIGFGDFSGNFSFFSDPVTAGSLPLTLLEPSPNNFNLIDPVCISYINLMI